MTRKSMSTLTLCIATALLAWPAAAGAQTPQAPAPPAPLPPVAQPSPAAAVARPVVDLRIDEAVQRALERNLDIAVERLNPQTVDLSLSGLLANYKPAFTSTVGYRDNNQFTTSQTAGADILNTATFTGNVGLAKNIPWGGGSFNVGFTNNRVNNSNRFATRNPTLNSGITANVFQPLLRSFRTDSTRTQIRVTQINQQMSQVQLKSVVTNTLSNVRNAYWDLVYAVGAVDVAQRSLDLANRLVQDNRTRVEIGTLAPLDVVQAESEAATRRQTLVTAVAAQRTAELALKRLIVSGTDDPVWKAQLNPVDRPDYAPENIDVDAAIRRALAERTDIVTAKEQLDINNTNLKLLRDQTLPAVDLSGGYGLSGIGGTTYVRNGLGGSISDIVPGGYWDALRTLGNLDAPSWNLAINVTYPLGTSSADANLARGRVQVQQSLAQIKQLELQVATDVTNAALNVQSNLESVQAARAARELMQQRLDAENSKFEVGMSTNFFVVQAQRDLADAANTELRALLNYRKSLVDFDRLQQTSLSRANITLISGGGGGGTTSTSSSSAGSSGSPTSTSTRTTGGQ